MTSDTVQSRPDFCDMGRNGLQTSGADTAGSGRAAQAEHHFGPDAERDCSRGAPSARRRDDRQDHHPGEARGARTSHTCSHASAHDWPEMNAALADGKSASAARVNRGGTSVAITPEGADYASQ